MFGQTQTSNIKKDDAILARLDSLHFLNLFAGSGYLTDTAILNTYGYSAEFIPRFNADILTQRIEKLDVLSPFDLVYNEAVQDYIDVYSIRKRDLVSKVLALSHLYFPLFEEQLDKHGLPDELKYLAIVESALNPKAISKSGAVGLWQFMYPTGKMFGLEQNSYVDDRKDPYKSTIAACKYLKYLYGLFGDWQIVLAAYNCGPGAVSKAIRRSGNKTNYWELRPFLPLETQNYVPAFIAATYVMNYHKEHNLFPVQIKSEFFFSDTITVYHRTDLKKLSEIIGIAFEDLAFINPAYKTGVIPASAKGYTLCIPATKAGVYLANHEEIITRCAEPARPLAYYQQPKSEKKQLTQIVHHIKPKENIFAIAKKYNCSAAQIRSWNNLKSNKIASKKSLKIYIPKPASIPEENTELYAQKNNNQNDSVNTETGVAPLAPEKETDNSSIVIDKKAEPLFIHHVVQKGDTLWKIANRYKVSSVEELKKLNNLYNNNLKLGEVIKVPVSQKG